MPSFDDHAVLDSPPEEVFKLLYDPARIPEWMPGVASVTDVRGADGGADFTLFPAGFREGRPGVAGVRDGGGAAGGPAFPLSRGGSPDSPMPRATGAPQARRRAPVPCHVSFLEFAWPLEEAGETRPRLGVHVELPE